MRTYRLVFIPVLFLLFVFIIVEAGSSDQALFFDFNSTTNTADISDIVSTGDTLFFAADDGLHGRELWVSGTDIGTHLVADILPGTGANNIYYTTVWDGIAYFVANDGQTGFELWRSDGTDNGTWQLKELTSGEEFSWPKNLTPFGEMLLFTSEASTGGLQLWKTDGTTDGTVQVKEDTPNLHIFGLTRLGDSVYFRAGSQRHLWRSAGTAETTYPIGETVANSDLVAFQNAIYFVAGENNEQLWRSDGTITGTLPIVNIPPYAADFGFHVANNLLFFVTDTGNVNGLELWRSDGTAVGTQSIFAFDHPIDYPLRLQNLLFGADSFLYFVVEHQWTKTIWKSDGTPAGTKQVSPIAVNGNADMMAVMGDRLFFAHSDANGNTEWWRTDGTLESTQAVDLGVEFRSSVLEMTPIGDTLYFVGSDELHGGALWRTDGTAAGTAFVYDANQTTASSGAKAVTVWQDDLYVQTRRGSYSASDDLWRTDGTISGTQRLSNSQSNLPEYVSRFVEPVVSGNYLYFSAYDNIHGTELWRTDGSITGTQIISDVVIGDPADPHSISSYPNTFLDFNDSLVFSITRDGNLSELWKTDGSAENTELIKELGRTSVNRPSLIFNGLNDDFYFATSTLWRSDGTAAGTVQIADFKPKEYTFFDGTLYLAINRHIYISDGTAEGTQLLKLIGSDLFRGYPSDFTELNGRLIFTAFYEQSNHALWVTDGTEEGTQVLIDINPEAHGFTLFSLTRFGDRIFFVGDDGATGQELWVTDGTAAGTQLFMDINIAGGSEPRELTVIDEMLYFSADDGIHGYQVWETDGTIAGTRRRTNFDFTSEYNYPHTFINYKGSIVFTAVDIQHGTELWYLPKATSIQVYLPLVQR